MSDDQRQESVADRWRTLPERIPLEEMVAMQEVPPKPQVIVDPGLTKLDEATRCPG